MGGAVIKTEAPSRLLLMISMSNARVINLKAMEPNRSDQDGVRKTKHFTLLHSQSILRQWVIPFKLERDQISFLLDCLITLDLRVEAYVFKIVQKPT